MKPRLTDQVFSRVAADNAALADENLRLRTQLAEYADALRAARAYLIDGHRNAALRVINDALLVEHERETP